jgi:GT2 family glycosyltransferase
MDRIQKVGSVNGLLIRVKPGELGVEIAKTPRHTSILLDGAGLMMHKSRRPDLRGNNQPAKPPYLKPTYIFGADAACALYRRSMLEDVAVGGEYFDEDFMIYREDVDLAWRAQLLGWDCLYLPSALAYHVRSFRPGQNRRSISTVLKRHSVKNGWLLVVKNDSAGALLKNLVWVLSYQLKILSGLVFVEPSSLAAIPSTVRLLPKILHKRTEIKKRRVRSEADMRKWFV